MLCFATQRNVMQPIKMTKTTDPVLCLLQHAVSCFSISLYSSAMIKRCFLNLLKWNIWDIVNLQDQKKWKIMQRQFVALTKYTRENIECMRLTRREREMGLLIHYLKNSNYIKIRISFTCILESIKKQFDCRHT